MYYIYILQSKKNGKGYTGSTGKLPEIRLKEHNIGTNQWTKANGPFELMYYESYICKADALRREKFFKSGLGRKLKKIIIKYFNV